MRAVMVAVAVSLGLAVPASAAPVEVETGPLVVQQVRALKTTDGIRLKDVVCTPIGGNYSVSNDRIFGSYWNCYVADGLSRAYIVHVHVRNSNGGGLDRLTVIFCAREFSHFACPTGARIILPQ